MKFSTKRQYLWLAKKLIFALLVIPIAIASSGVAFGNGSFQGITVTGRVIGTDDNSELPGVNVVIKGTTQGTVTDLEGAYTIEVPGPETVLVFSSVGYVTVEFAVENKSVINVNLAPDVTALEEIVVVGYGSVRKSDVTGAVSSVGSEELNAYPVLSSMQALQGRAAGVVISSVNGGQPGSEMSVKVRGGTSINASSEPLRVVDGFVGAAMPPPEDIASMEVLKDASATAIYGSRGANGVIMITTKKGTVGKVKVDLNSSYSVQQTSNRLDLLNADEFTDYMNEIIPYTNLGSDTDWQDQILTTGSVFNNQLSISGGTENLDYYVSGTYYNQQGIVINSNFDRYSITSNLNFKLNDKIKVGLNLFANNNKSDGVITQEETGGTGSTGVMASSFRFNPDLGIYNSDGSFTTSTVGDELDNPYTIASQYVNEKSTNLLQSNAYFDYEILDWLSFKTTFGASESNYKNGTYYPTTMLKGQSVNGLATINLNSVSNILSENYFTIKKDFESSRLNWVNGYSYQKRTRESESAGAQNFISDAAGYWALQQGSVTNKSTSNLTESVLKSYYSRLNYALKDKYIFTATARYDGASNFAENNKWAFFPSGAVAWDMKEEAFMSSVNAITTLKWRASYGLTGNQAISAYESLASFVPTYSNIEGQNAITVDNIGNPNLTWETTSQLDIGFDFGMLNNRVSISADYYDKLTTDLLFARKLPSYGGVAEQLQNIGDVENKGFEFMLSSDNLVGAITWSSDLMFAKNNNKVITLPDSTVLYGSGPGHLHLNNDFQMLAEGESVGAFYGYVYVGVHQPGDPYLEGSEGSTPGAEYNGGETYADLNDDGILNAEDRMIIGNPHPDFTWSFNNNLTYKNFDMNIFFQGVSGNDMFNITAMELGTMSAQSNASTVALNRWSMENQDTDVPAVKSRAYKVSSRWIEDGSYVRLKNLSLGYTFPSEILEKLKIRKLRIYASAQNILTFTKYTGMDPEVAYQNLGDGANTADSNRNLGMDYASYPNVKTFTFGLNLGF